MKNESMKNIFSKLVVFYNKKIYLRNYVLKIGNKWQET